MAYATKVSNGKVVPKSKPKYDRSKLPQVSAGDTSATYSNPVTPDYSQQNKESPIPTSFTFVLGFSLLVVSGLSSGQFGALWDAVWNGNISSTLKQDAIVLSGELIFIFILSFLAEANSDANNVIIAFFFALWIGWGIFNGPTLVKWTNTMSGGKV